MSDEGVPLDLNSLILESEESEEAPRITVEEVEEPPKIHMALNLTANGRGSVTLDGKEVPKLVRVYFEASAGEPPHVTLVVIPDTLEVTGPIDPVDVIELDRD